MVECVYYNISLTNTSMYRTTSK